MQAEPRFGPRIGAAVDRSPVIAGVAAGAAVVLAVATILRLGLTANGVLWAAAQVLLVFIGWYDALELRILNVVVAPAAVVAVLLRLLFERNSLLECLAAGAIAFGFFYVLALTARGGLGMGDVKLAGLIGLLLGTDAAYALMLGVVVGGIAAAAILASRRSSRKSSYAYGPYLAFGAVVMILSSHPPPLL